MYPPRSLPFESLIQKPDGCSVPLRLRTLPNICDWIASPTTRRSAPFSSSRTIPLVRSSRRLRPSVLGIGAPKRRRRRPFLVFNHDCVRKTLVSSALTERVRDCVMVVDAPKMRTASQRNESSRTCRSRCLIRESGATLSRMSPLFPLDANHPQ